jgi:murein L,D-transpeptidase YafK
MFVRSFISFLLISLGILSPWLVRDWLEWRSQDGVLTGIYRKFSDFPEEILVHLRGDKGGSGVASITGNDSAGEVEPYPLANRTMRFFEGFQPSKDRGSATQLLDAVISSSDSDWGPELKEGSNDELSSLQLKAGDPVFLRLFKEENELEFWMRGTGVEHYTLFKVYRLRDWSGKLGPKLKEGDRQTPEGFYYVGASRLRPGSHEFLGIDVGFPNEYDNYRGRVGGGLMIHGGRSHDGNFVISPEDMREIYLLSEAALKSGQQIFRVHIFPFRMTDKRMEQEWDQQPDWIDFWANLKEGYDFFENVNFPPDVAVAAGDYVFRFPRS